MTRPANGLYDLYTRYVQTVALGLLASGGAAFAGGWEEFETRCLEPYENVFPTILSGLDEVRGAPVGIEVGADERVHGPTPDGSYLIIEQNPPDGFEACRIVIAGDVAAARSAFEAWADVQLKQMRYEEVPSDEVADGERAFLSFEWIEPVLGVQMRATADGGLVLRMVETDLES